MGEQRNLTEENVEVLKKQLEKMKFDNPDLEYRFWEQDEPKEELSDEKPSTGLADRVSRIEEAVEYIKHAIGDHVLINGQWVDITRK